MKPGRPARSQNAPASSGPSTRRGRVTRLVALALAAAALVGCGSTAGVRRTDGTVVEANIVGSDPDGLYVRGEDSQQVVRMDGRSIVDVDHPGNAAMVVGALLLGEVAILMTDRGFRHELIDGQHGDGSMAARPVAMMFGIPGALVLGHGLVRYTMSKRAAHGFEQAFEQAGGRPLPSAPPAMPAPGAGPAAFSPGPLTPPFARTLASSGASSDASSDASPCSKSRLATLCPR